MVIKIIIVIINVSILAYLVWRSMCKSIKTLEPEEEEWIPLNTNQNEQEKNNICD